VRVGLYARVSTERQQERGTVASQLEALRAMAEANGDEIVEEFVDDGYSGARLDRPALDGLRDAAEAGVLEGVVCLCADRLARAYAYQVLILEELERFGVTVRFLEGPALGEDPQATLLVQMQGVIAEYERAKIAERYRRGKLYRARAGEIFFWKMSYGFRRVVPDDGGPARMEIFEPEAQVVREIFRAYVEDERPMRQIAHDLHDRGVPSPTGKPVWGVSTIGRLLRNEAYIGTVYYNRREAIDGNGPRGARTRKTRYRERPREEWIAIPVPAIVDQATFERAQQVSRDNSKWNPRGAEPGAWLLRGLIECGHCGVGANCHKMRGRNGTFHRYYYCRNHDVLRAGGHDRRCPERNIRADELDAFVLEQVRQALLDPRQLIAGERAVITATPPDEDELIAAQLKHLDSALETTDRERTRLLDAYQAGLLELDELTRRTATLTTRRDQLARERDATSERSAELASQNRLRRGLAGFAQRVAASLDELDYDARQRLLRLVVEKVRVQGWRVEIHLKIPLQDDSDGGGEPTPPTIPPRPSSDVRLRSLDGLDRREVVHVHVTLEDGHDQEQSDGQQADHAEHLLDAGAVLDREVIDPEDQEQHAGADERPEGDGERPELDLPVLAGEPLGRDVAADQQASERQHRRPCEPVSPHGHRREEPVHAAPRLRAVERMTTGFAWEEAGHLGEDERLEQADRDGHDPDQRRERPREDDDRPDREEQQRRHAQRDREPVEPVQGPRKAEGLRGACRAPVLLVAHPFSLRHLSVAFVVGSGAPSRPQAADISLTSR
jgi:site-specific DNA recombinase